MNTTVNFVVLSAVLNFGITTAAVAISGRGVRGCDVDPKHWCENRQTAKKCGVLNQCTRFVWKSAFKPVSVALYYESLCESCEYFIRDQLHPVYEKIGAVMNVTLVPYGNAREHRDGSTWKYQCQHGKQECIGNIIETCTINIVKDVSKYLPYITCIETSILDAVPAAQKCAKKFPKIPIEKILKCSSSILGNRWEHEMALKTDALQPPHQYVPWIVVNGVHTEKTQDRAQSDLLGLVCELYQGPKPAACH